MNPVFCSHAGTHYGFDVGAWPPWWSLTTVVLSPHLPRSLATEVNLTFFPHRPGLFSQVGKLFGWAFFGPPFSLETSLEKGACTEGFGFVFFLAALLLASHGFSTLTPSLPRLPSFAPRPPSLWAGSSRVGFQLASMAWSWLAKGLSR